MASKCTLCLRSFKAGQETELHTEPHSGPIRVHSACRAFFYPRVAKEGKRWDQKTLKRKPAFEK